MKDELDRIEERALARTAARKNELLEARLACSRTAEQGMFAIASLRSLRGLRAFAGAKSEKIRSYQLTTA